MRRAAETDQWMQGTPLGRQAVEPCRSALASPAGRSQPPAEQRRPIRRRGQGLVRSEGCRAGAARPIRSFDKWRSEEHTSELQSLMRISYAVFCLKKKNKKIQHTNKKNYNINATNQKQIHK